MGEADDGGRALRILLELREQIVQARQAELAGVVQRLQLADAALSEAEAACSSARGRLAEVRERSLPGQLSLRDAQSWQAFQRRLEEELASLQIRHKECLDEQARCRQRCSQAGEALAAAHAERVSVERAWLRWDQARRRQAERRAEEELAEVAAARGRPAR